MTADEGTREHPREVLSVGISDLISHRECPRRAAYGARRHTGEGLQDHAVMTPEAGSPATWYGSAIHDVIDAVEDGLSDDAAIEVAWSRWGRHLYPEHLALLRDDLDTYRERDPQNVRTILAEGEIRIPLCELDDGREVWFRGRIDRLYERLERPGHFIHIDYKSGAYVKSHEEIESDIQMWAYNLLICEFFPEVEVLEQHLDQLRDGGLSEPVFKSAAQREEIREWLIVQARDYFATRQDAGDGLPSPLFNQWCPWCPILESCQVIPNLTDWALSRIAEMRPADMGADDVLAATPMEEYLERYDDVNTAIATLTRYLDSVKSIVREVPDARRQQLGFELRGRRNSVIDVQAREALYRGLGHEQFINMVRVTQERLKSLEDKEQREWALSLVQKVPGTRVVHRIRR